MAEPLRQFAIISPDRGLRTDAPTQLLQDAITPTSENVRTEDGEIHRVLGRAALLTTPAFDVAVDYAIGKAVLSGGLTYVSNANPNVGNTPPHANWTVTTVPNSAKPILRYHNLNTTAGSAFLFAFTEDDIYLWDDTNSYWNQWIDPHDDAAPIVLTATTEWSTDTINDKVVATNNLEPILVGDGSSPFVFLDINASAANRGLDTTGNGTANITRVKFVRAFQNFLLACNIFEPTASPTASPRRIQYSVIGDHTDWDSLTSTAGFLDTPGQAALNGSELDGDHCVMIKDERYGTIWLTTHPDIPFEYADISTEFGCKAPDSFVTASDGTLVFLASDRRIRRVRDGQEISGAVDDVLNLIPYDSVGAVRGHRIESLDEVWWAIPHGSGQTANNRVLTVAEGGVWNLLTWDIQAFGSFQRQSTLTINGLDAEFDTIKDWGDAWDSIDSVQAAEGFVFDIATDSTGATYQLNASVNDKGASFDGKFSLGTTLTEQPDIINYKRLFRIRLYVLRDSGTTMTVSIKLDGNTSFVLIGSESIPSPTASDNSEIPILDYPCDFRAKHFEVLIESNDGAFRVISADFLFRFDGRAA